jgi:hypothetical protein
MGCYFLRYGRLDILSVAGAAKRLREIRLLYYIGYVHQEPMKSHDLDDRHDDYGFLFF